MTDAEAIAAVRRGERVSGPYSLHPASKAERCWLPRCTYRTLFCDGDTDVVECSVCGHQRLARCTFDEDFA